MIVMMLVVATRLLSGVGTSQVDSWTSNWKLPVLSTQMMPPEIGHPTIHIFPWFWGSNLQDVDSAMSAWKRLHGFSGDFCWWRSCQTSKKYPYFSKDSSFTLTSAVESWASWTVSRTLITHGVLAPRNHRFWWKNLGFVTLLNEKNKTRKTHAKSTIRYTVYIYTVYVNICIRMYKHICRYIYIYICMYRILIPMILSQQISHLSCNFRIILSWKKRFWVSAFCFSAQKAMIVAIQFWDFDGFTPTSGPKAVLSWGTRTMKRYGGKKQKKQTI